VKLTNQLWGMLNDTEQALLRELEPERFAELDEDGLVDLHDRVRRARNKYSKQYRRGAREQVRDDAGRARASAVHRRAAVKAEVFEDALAVVSRELAKVARQAAAELKAERLAAARADRGGSPDAGAPSAGSGAASGPRSAKVQRRTPATKKASASSRSRTRATQAKRDAR
jgi:hypothetical protein